MSKAGSTRRARAGAVAAVLAVAIALTGTMAWRSISQEAINEFMENKNPGGRIHDDFRGTENKDVYAENFTDVDNGMPVFVRIRLEEYMEIGEDAGIKRNDTGRKATSLAPSRKDPMGATPADINDTTTWFIHKPLKAGETDPFHDYWTWDQDGSTIYMPTFNKNKDSLSVDVNGTYKGPNNTFDDIDPYQDNYIYADGEKKTGKAYYDADDDDIDENYGKTGTDPFSGIPGAGGDIKNGINPDPDYEEKNEEHTAKSTLNGLGVITMADWIAAGKPVCNKWVWDEDGWYYWPEPVMPQTATGLVLDKVTEKATPSGKAYYAINIVGQFVDANKSSWGEPEKTEDDGSGGATTVPATGFYIDGFTPNAQKLLEQAVSVKVVKDAATGKEHWYLPIDGETNLYKEILDDEGTLGHLICAFEDRTIHTADDRTDVVYVKDGVTVGTTDYGNYFLEPRPGDPYNEPYYRGVGPDGLLGTGDDTRLWLPTGNTFPNGVLDKVADTVTIVAPTTAAGGFSELVPGTTGEMEVGKTSSAFTASVTLNGNPSFDQGVTWSVAAADGSNLAAGTKITTVGVLTVDANETAKDLIITAKSKLDNRVYGTYTVKVYGKPNVKVTSVNGATAIEAGKTITFRGQLCRGDDAVPTQPTSYTWKAYGTDGNEITTGLTITPDQTNKTATVEVLDTFVLNGSNGTITVTADPDDPAIDASLVGETTFTVTPPASISITVPTDVVDPSRPHIMAWEVKDSSGGKYPVQTVTWTVKDNSGNFIAGVTIDPTTGKLAVDHTVADNTKVKVTATSTVDPTVSETVEVTVSGAILIDGRVVNIDGIDFYVMTTNEAGDETLLFAKNCIGESEFSSSNNIHWNDAGCTVRTYLQNWLSGKPTLSANAKAHTITTRDEYNGVAWDTTTDSIFLLSESDVNATISNSTTRVDTQDYTCGGMFKWKSGGDWSTKDATGSTASHWWLRSPYDNANMSGRYFQPGLPDVHSRTDSCGVRPALWVNTSCIPTP